MAFLNYLGNAMSRLIQSVLLESFESEPERELRRFYQRWGYCEANAVETQSSTLAWAPVRC